jgi:hypothetical protein
MLMLLLLLEQVTSVTLSAVVLSLPSASFYFVAFLKMGYEVPTGKEQT